YPARQTSLCSFPILRSPRSSLFPYTTLFRSRAHDRHARSVPEHGVPVPAVAVPGVACAAGDRAGAVVAGHVHADGAGAVLLQQEDRKSTRLNSSHVKISYAVFCVKKKRLN